MTVAELIEKLKELNPNDKIYLYDRYFPLHRTTYIEIKTEDGYKEINIPLYG